MTGQPATTTTSAAYNAADPVVGCVPKKYRPAVSPAPLTCSAKMRFEFMQEAKRQWPPMLFCAGGTLTLNLELLLLLALQPVVED